MFFQGTSSFEAGLRGHHHFISSILKSTFEKEESNKLSIVIYKHFQWQHFENNLKSTLDNCNGNFDEYEKSLPLHLTRMPERKIKLLEEIMNLITIKIFAKQS